MRFSPAHFFSPLHAALRLLQRWARLCPTARPIPGLLAIILLLTAPAASLADQGGRISLFDNLPRTGAGAGNPAARQWRLTADSMTNDMATNVVEAKGNALARSGDDFMRADQAFYYHDSQWLHLNGGVRMQWEGYTIEAQKAEVDLVNKVGWLTKGRIVTSAEPRIYIEGESIEKVGERSYTFHTATVTACETGPGNEEPAWSMAMDEAKITAEDFAQLYHPRLRIEGVPAFYLPYLAFPTTTKRTSGLLFPELGYSSKMGYYAMQPYYWAVSPEHDLTFYEYAFSSRGFMQGLEWRATPDAMSRLMARLDVMYDSQTAGTETDEPSRFQGDGLIRPNNLRYWLRSKYNGHLDDPRWLVKVDTDYVSDQNYLREITVGEAAYNRSRTEMLNRFGRDLAVKDSLTRESAAVVNRDFEDLGVSAKASYTQNLAYENGNHPGSRDPTVQRLPELRLFAFKDRLGGSPLEYEADAEAVNLWRRYGATAQRLDLHPKVSMPISGRFGSVIPGVGFRQTLYSIDRRPSEDGQSGDSFESRSLPEVSLSAMSEFFRVFDVDQAPPVGLDTVGQTAWTRLKHTLQPRLEYVWQEDGIRSSLPRLDPLDRLEGVHMVRWSLTSILDRKRAGVVLSPQPDSTYVPAPTTDYLEFLRIRLEQGFDIRESQRDDMLDTYERRPFSDVLADVTIMPFPWLWLTNRTYISPYSGSISEHDHYLSLTDPERGNLFFGLDFVHKPETYQRRLDQAVNSVVAGGRINLDHHWSLYGRTEHDYERNREVESVLEVTYRHHCYDLVLGYEHTPFDTTFMIKINLMGLSSPSFRF